MVTEVNFIKIFLSSTGGLVSEMEYDSDKQKLGKNIKDVDNKMRNTSGLVKKTDLQTKITEIENKLPNITGLVNTVVDNTKFTDIENKITDISNLAGKAALNTKAAETEMKYLILVILLILKNSID